MDNLREIYIKERREKKTELGYSEWLKQKIESDPKYKQIHEAWMANQEQLARGKEKVFKVLRCKSCEKCIYAKSYPGQTTIVWKCTAVREPFVITGWVRGHKKNRNCPIVRMYNQLQTAHINNLVQEVTGDGSGSDQEKHG